uniref:3-phosphoshikimate 1-carboxyvinyltransferase n=1 Tax=Brassica campestris TaxID=3711 RepID=M4CL13_BRACM
MAQASRICHGVQNPCVVLQPIREISGLIKLPGSKSLSNRILLLAALSEVQFSLVVMGWAGLPNKRPVYDTGRLLRLPTLSIFPKFSPLSSLMDASNLGSSSKPAFSSFSQSSRSGGRGRGNERDSDHRRPQGRGGGGGGRGGGGGGKDRIDALGRLLTRILRHMATELRLNMRGDGFVKVGDLLQLNLKTSANVQLKSHTIDEIREAVRRDNKQRFSLVEENGELLIRANQGHSITTVESEKLLKPILSPEEAPVCVHGTYRKNLESILASGLKRMNRLHVHFSCGLPTDGEVISGMRRNVNVLIFLDIKKALEGFSTRTQNSFCILTIFYVLLKLSFDLSVDGIAFYVSDNKVILTEGIDGVVPVDYFHKIDKTPGHPENFETPGVEGTTVVDNLLNSDDINYIYMLDALNTLGLNVERDSVNNRAVVEGCGGIFPASLDSKSDIELYLGNAGTAMRPLTAAGGNARSPGNAYVEGDASIGETVTVEGCGTTSLQGDVKFAEVLEKMGCKVSWTENSVTVTGPSRDAFGMRHLGAVDVNMDKMPDVAMTLAVVALFADGPTTIRDVASWRVKETERMIAICTELRKLGATVEEGSDYCVITPPAKVKPAEIDTYDDHRMAMTFSLAACADVPVTIKDLSLTTSKFLKAVRRDNKQLFSLVEENGELLSRANQGHSITTVESDKLLKPILSPEEAPVCVHGTYKKNLESILASGLKRMNRLHVHFSCGLPTDGEVISDGIAFYISDNKVILTEGVDGVVAVDYFQKIESWPSRQPIPF